MMKMSFTNNQVAFDYVLYMIVGSYFKKATCSRSQLQEKRMFLQYKEQKMTSQLAMEDACITFVEEELLEKLPDEILQQEVEVRILRRSEEKRFLCFEGEGFRLICQVEIFGKGKVAFNAWFKAKSKDAVMIEKQFLVRIPKSL